MNVLPLDLWKTIMEFSEPHGQLKLKQTSKYLYDNLEFDNSYLNSIRLETEDYMRENGVSYNDIIRHAVQQNNFSKSKLAGFIDKIRKDKDIGELKCVGHILDRLEPDLDDEDESMICILCNAEYPCKECYDIYKNNKEMIDNDITGACNYIIIDCGSCSEPIKAYVCMLCYKIQSKCHCSENSEYNVDIEHDPAGEYFIDNQEFLDSL